MHTFKITATIIVLLSLIIVSGIFTLKVLNTSSKRIENQASAIENNTRSGNWEQAKAGLIALKKDWDKTSNVWSALIDHIEIDNIDASLTKMEKYIALKDTSPALAEAATLSQLIKHIPEKEAFNLKNIL
jgi:hypothetical protein